MRVVWEGSAPTWMVFAGPPSALDCSTFGALDCSITSLG
jgi:hypothetical protein